MEHCHPSVTPPPAGIDPAAPATPAAAPKPRRCTADYRWTQPKVIAFLEALAQSGRVAEAARMVGMSRQAAYDLRARLASARFDAAFEGARRKGIRARAAASRARLAAARSPWEGPGIAELAARHRAGVEAVPESVDDSPPQADTLPAQADTFAAQADTSPARADTRTPQADAAPPQADGFSHKPTIFSPGPCNTRSMSYAAARADRRARGAKAAITATLVNFAR